MKYISRISKQALKDLYHWQQHDPKTAKKIEKIINEVLESPASGLGKPERLRTAEGVVYSRRINKKDRLVYSIENGYVYISQCRGHYQDK